LTIIKSETAAFRIDSFPVGTLICRENANPPARFALIARGEEIHVSNYPSMPGADYGGSPARPGLRQSCL